MQYLSNESTKAQYKCFTFQCTIGVLPTDYLLLFDYCILSNETFKVYDLITLYAQVESTAGKLQTAIFINLKDELRISFDCQLN